MQAHLNLRAEKISKKNAANSFEPQPHSPTYNQMSPPYRGAINPHNTSLIMSKANLGESSHSLKTSTELLKVLNRIWSLEEKHALDMSLLKTLRTELRQSQDQTQELLQEKNRDKKEIDNLTAKIMELKFVRKKDQERIRDAVNSLEEKLKNELKSRRHTEKHHQKLANELSDVKHSFSDALKELEGEKKSRGLLEELCDEFAKVVRDYEQEIRVMKQKSSDDRVMREGSGNDRFILHISEAWLDERTQMKLNTWENQSQSQSPLDKLRNEIETFLQARKPGNANEEENISSQSLKQEYGFGLDNMGIGRRSLRSGRNSISIPTDAHVDLQVTARDSSASFLEGSFDPAMFTGPTSPVKKWVSRVSAAEDTESSSRWTKGVKPNTLKAKMADARPKGLLPRTRTARRSLSTKATR